MKLIKLLTCISLASFLYGCTITGGLTGGNANYAFPNSNVVALGKVKATDSSMMYGTAGITAEKMQELLDKALSKSADADIIINYTLDTSSTSLFPFVTYVSMTLEGTAAKMVVGKQDLESATKLDYTQ